MTALKYYRWFRSIRTDVLEKDLPVVKWASIPRSCKATEIAPIVNSIMNITNEDAVDVLVKNTNNLHKIKNLHIFKSSLKYPKNSFRKIDNFINISSPELLFYQLSSSLTFVELLLVGFELCGCYAILEDPQDTLITDIRKLTTPKIIQEYLMQLHKSNINCQHILKAIKAANFLADNSFSPQETRLYIMLCMPRKLGGYGVTGMRLNSSIQLSNSALKEAGQNIIIPDISNIKTKVAIEYDSSVYHEDPHQNQRDKIRINALNHDNWKVFNFVKLHTRNVHAMHIMATDILKANGQSPRIKNKNFSIKRDELYKSLYENYDTNNKF